MQQQKKLFSQANDAEPMSNRHRGNRALSKSDVVQPTSAIAAQTKKQTATSHVYRLGQAQRTAQAKMANEVQQNRKPTVAPPVYAPQPLPRPVQTETSRAPQVQKPPVAPPVYRPQHTLIVLQT